jgi:hypothetical protein
MMAAAEAPHTRGDTTDHWLVATPVDRSTPRFLRMVQYSGSDSSASSGKSVMPLSILCWLFGGALTGHQPTTYNHMRIVEGI